MTVADYLAPARIDHPSPIVEEGYCSECGRLFSEQAIGRTTQPARRSWSHWTLLALGVYLLVLFGPRAVVDLNSVANGHDPAAQRRALSAAEGPSVLAAMARTETAQTPLDLFAADRSPHEHALMATGLGLPLVLLGFGGLVRQQVSRRTRPALGSESKTAPPVLTHHAARSALSLWEFGEGLVLAAGRILLLFACYFGVTAFLRGEPPSWELVDHATNRTVDLISIILQLTRAT